MVVVGCCVCCCLACLSCSSSAAYEGVLCCCCCCCPCCCFCCLSVLVFPPLTMLCTLLYFTLRYLTSPGVSASEGAIDIINAFQEIMFKCSKMLYNFDSGITYKLSCNGVLVVVLVPARTLACNRSTPTKRMLCIHVFNYQC